MSDDLKETINNLQKIYANPKNAVIENEQTTRVA